MTSTSGSTSGIILASSVEGDESEEICGSAVNVDQVRMGTFMSLIVQNVTIPVAGTAMYNPTLHNSHETTSTSFNGIFIRCMYVTI